MSPGDPLEQSHLVVRPLLMNLLLISVVPSHWRLLKSGSKITWGNTEKSNLAWQHFKSGCNRPGLLANVVHKVCLYLCCHGSLQTSKNLSQFQGTLKFWNSLSKVV